MGGADQVLELDDAAPGHQRVLVRRETIGAQSVPFAGSMHRTPDGRIVLAWNLADE